MKSEPESSRCSIVSVCFFSDAVASEMVASAPVESELIIVDNSPSASPSLEQLAHKRGGLYIHNSINIGFGPACNQGARASNREFILFLNPDARLAPGSLNQLIETLDNHPTAVAANPRILTTGNQVQFKYRSTLLPKREWHARRPPASTAAVPVLHGGALIVRRQSFFEIGGFDEKIFLYHEDDDLSIRLRRHGGQLLYAPDATAYHISGSSSPRSAAIAYHKAFRMAQSRIYSMHKHGMRHGRLSTIITALLQLASPASLVSRRKRMKAWGYLWGGIHHQQPVQPTAVRLDGVGRKAD